VTGGDSHAQTGRGAVGQGFERHPGLFPAGSRLGHLAEEGRDEVPGAQDPRIGGAESAGPAGGRRLAAEAADETPTLELRSTALGKSSRHEGR